MDKLIFLLIFLFSMARSLCYAGDLTLGDAAFDCQAKILLFSEWTDPSAVPINPENQFLKLSEGGIQLHLRPDVQLSFDNITFQLKPRLITKWEHWAGGLDKEDETDTELFINEWSVRTALSDRLFLIGGRENLQWGPSYLQSLSNPFFNDNGKISPRQEVPGMDFIRIVFLPSDLWTISGIANVKEGAADITSDEFHPSYALKLDFYGTQSYAGLIVSYHQHPEEYRIGYYAGYTASDALILYTEGMSSGKGIHARYPVAVNNPIGTGFETKSHDLFEQGAFLVGGSYTTEVGPTIVLEYLYYGYGYDDEQASAYFNAIDTAALNYSNTGAIKSLSTFVLSQALTPGTQFLRKNYLMAQIYDSDVHGVFDYTFRYTCNMDDWSSQAVLLLEMKATDNINFFSIFRTKFGGVHSDYGSDLFDYYGMFGIEYNF